MKIVLKIGGSIIYPKEVDVNFVKKLAEKLAQWSKRHEIAVVVGGGALSREYDKIGRRLTDDEDYLDLLGIYASRLNAALLVAALGNAACPAIPRSEVEFLDLLLKYQQKVIVCGGFRPKQRTDAVAVEIAKVWSADYVIKGTNVDYVYDSDPKKNKKAKPIKAMSFQDLQKYSDQTHKANQPTIMDKVSAGLIASDRIKVAVVNGKNLENIEKFLNRQDFKGTKIGF